MNAKPNAPARAKRSREDCIRPSRSFYLRKFGHLMNAIRTELIIVGLFVVLMTYAGNLAGDLEFVVKDAVLAAVLLMLATAFTAYDVIAGEIFITGRAGNCPKEWRVRPMVVIGLFILELMMFIVNLGILLMPLMIVLDINFMDVSAAQIFALAAIWHLINVLWYLVSPVELRDFIRHGGYALINAALFLLISTDAYSALPIIGGWSHDLMTVAGYAIIVSMIYAIQIRGYIAESAAAEAEM